MKSQDSQRKTRGLKETDQTIKVENEQIKSEILRFKKGRGDKIKDHKGRVYKLTTFEYLPISKLIDKQKELKESSNLDKFFIYRTQMKTAKYVVVRFTNDDYYPNSFESLSKAIDFINQHSSEQTEIMTTFE